MLTSGTMPTFQRFHTVRISSGSHHRLTQVSDGERLCSVQGCEWRVHRGHVPGNVVEQACHAPRGFVSSPHMEGLYLLVRLKLAVLL